jgi:hypothetical protein
MGFCEWVCYDFDFYSVWFDSRCDILFYWTADCVFDYGDESFVVVYQLESETRNGWWMN